MNIENNQLLCCRFLRFLCPPAISTSSLLFLKSPVGMAFWTACLRTLSGTFSQYKASFLPRTISIVIALLFSSEDQRRVHTSSSPRVCVTGCLVK